MARYHDVFEKPSSGLRNQELANHMLAEHKGTLRAQLDANHYKLAYVSHDWLADVHHVAHEEELNALHDRSRTGESESPEAVAARLRQRAAEEMATEFGTDISEWTV